MQKIKYFPLKRLAKNIILIDGIARSGKLLTGAIVSSFQKTEHLEFGLNFEHFCPAVEFNKVSIDFAKAYLNSYLNELIYNKYLSRNANFRPNDRTSVLKSSNPQLYKNRLKQKEGDRIVRLINKQKKNLPFITHDLLVTINGLNKLDINYKMIHLFRNPIDLIISWYKRGLGKRYGKDQRQWTLLMQKKNKIYPWYDYLFKENEKKNNELEKCANYVFFLTKISLENFKKIKKNQKKKIFITSYERIVYDTFLEFKRIAKFLNSGITKNTIKFMKNEKCPKKYDKLSFSKKKLFIKKNINKILFEKILKLEREFSNNIYGIG